MIPLLDKLPQPATHLGEHGFGGKTKMQPRGLAMPQCQLVSIHDAGAHLEEGLACGHA